ncbi:MAG: hypothetical protein U0166_29180 [Acidobacteriota bacterium]
MAPKVLTGIGCFLFGISFLVLAVSLLLPVLTDGRTSWDEAAAGYIPGAACSCFSLLPLGGGVAWLLLSRKKSAPPAE